MSSGDPHRTKTLKSHRLGSTLDNLAEKQN